MNTSRLHLFGPRLLAGFGTAALLTGIGLAASRPVHSAGGPIPVMVANAPLLTTNADDHDKQGVQVVTEADIADGNNHGSPSSTVYTVPPHKRLVIEAISAITSDNDRFSIYCFTQGGIDENHVFSSFNVLPNGTLVPTGSVHPHQYADAGTTVKFSSERTGYSGLSVVQINFTGYLVDMP